MLCEFQGIIDQEGLARFEQRSDWTRLADNNEESLSKRVPFWAVLDTEIATEILRELMQGSRKRALRILEESAVSLGTRTGR